MNQARIIGVGGAGVNCVESLICLGMPSSMCVTVNTGAVFFSQTHAEHKILLKKSLLKKKDLDRELNFEDVASPQNLQLLESTMAACDQSFVIAGMGGGTGTVVSPAIVRYCMKLGIVCMPIVTMPFSFEGEKRRKTAEIGIELLKKCTGNILTFSNDQLRKVTSGNCSFKEIVDAANKLIYKTIRHKISEFKDAACTK